MQIKIGIVGSRSYTNKQKIKDLIFEIKENMREKRGCEKMSGRKKKTGNAKLWRSICLVMKIFRTVSSDVV